MKVAESLGPGNEIMKAISRAWKAACEAAATHVFIRGSPLPLNLGSRFPSLTTLDLQECTDASPEALSSLRNLHQLSNLKMNFGDVKDGHVEALRSLPLAALELEPGYTSVTGSTLERFKGLPLVHLELRDTSMNPDAIGDLKGMLLKSLRLPNLYLLCPSHPRCTVAADLDVLKGMSLQTLDLGGQNLRNKDLGILQELPSLTDLALGHSWHYDLGWSDITLAALGGCGWPG